MSVYECGDPGPLLHLRRDALHVYAPWPGHRVDAEYFTIRLRLQIT